MAPQDPVLHLSPCLLLLIQRAHLITVLSGRLKQKTQYYCRIDIPGYLQENPPSFLLECSDMVKSLPLLSRQSTKHS